MASTQLTQDGYKKLVSELDELKDKKKPLAIDRLQKARAMGDLRENNEYAAAKEDLAFIEGRIRELEELIKNAEVVQAATDTNKVQIGDTVIVKQNGKKETYTIVGEFEADPMQKKLSNSSPIGKALLGKELGETINVDVPVGTIKFEILEIKAK
jgi:transcription elongation factor GreA